MALEKFGVKDGIAENLKVTSRIVEKAPNAVVTGIELFDNNLQNSDLFLLEDMINRNRNIKSFDVVQNILESADEEGKRVLVDKVNDLKYCVDEVAKKSAITDIVNHLDGM